MQRRDTSNGEISIPTACITDMDVMPDCAPEIHELVTGPTDPKWKSTTRRWKAVRDFGATAAEQKAGMAEHRQKRMASDGQCVRTFVADHWTLEYDLAYSGLAREVHAAAYLAVNEEKVDQGKVTRAALLVEAETAFKAIETAHSTKEARCSAVYKLVKKASKTITAQHLIDLIEERFEANKLDAATLRGSLSKSVIHAIEYATSGSAVPPTGPTLIPVAMGTVAGTSAAVEESEE